MDNNQNLSYDEYRKRVLALTEEVFKNDKEDPEEIRENDIVRGYEAGSSVLSTAANSVAEIRLRKYDRGPYSYHEQRVVEYLARIIPEIGAGFDPVGFLIASHEGLRLRSKQLAEKVDEAGIDRSHIY